MSPFRQSMSAFILTIYEDRDIASNVIDENILNQRKTRRYPTSGKFATQTKALKYEMNALTAAN